MDSRKTPDGLLIQFQEFTWTPDGVHQEAWLSVRPSQGQRVNLVQVTGNASISGYVNIDLYFHTLDGPVKINVEAYVVKGMSTPLILGNDFVDQNSISVICQEGSCTIEFGDSN